MKENAITTIMPTRSLLAETSSKVIKYYSFNIYLEDATPAIFYRYIGNHDICLLKI